MWSRHVIEDAQQLREELENVRAALASADVAIEQAQALFNSAAARLFVLNRMAPEKIDLPLWDLERTVEVMLTTRIAAYRHRVGRTEERR